MNILFLSCIAFKINFVKNNSISREISEIQIFLILTNNGFNFQKKKFLNFFNNKMKYEISHFYYRYKFMIELVKKVLLIKLG